jgi:hypothetical protein
MNIKEFWQDVLEQIQEKFNTYFHKEAVICWHCSN